MGAHAHNNKEGKRQPQDSGQGEWAVQACGQESQREVHVRARIRGCLGVREGNKVPLPRVGSGQEVLVPRTALQPDTTHTHTPMGTTQV
jgi:hypothetical protein